jgi:hypothetical protein
VVVKDPLVFAQWHLGLIGWGAALKCGAIEVSGSRDLCRALPTWNEGPAKHAEWRATHEQGLAATSVA